MYLSVHAQKAIGSSCSLDGTCTRTESNLPIFGFVCCSLSDQTRSIVVIWVKIFKTEKTIEIHLVRLTELCG